MIIESKRLILREWEYSDIDDLVEGLNNINVSNGRIRNNTSYNE